MGKDCGSWVHHQCPHHQPPDNNCISYVPHSLCPNALPYSVNKLPSISTEKNSGHTGCKLPQSQTGIANGPQGWFYGLSRYRQAFTPMPISDSTPKELNVYLKKCTNDILLSAVSRPTERKFIVVDHSMNQTSLIYRRGTEYPNHHGNVVFDHRGHPIEQRGAKAASLYGLNEVIAVESEMNEDTEELDALLYSDEDESECDCDAVSTGHSPIKRIGPIVVEENTSVDEVASSGGGHLKRKRPLIDRDCSASSLVDTGSSGKPSSGGENPSKLLKRDKILETIGILEDIIPGGRNKNGMFVLDEAIQYLKSLKLKAKSLGEM